MSELKIARGDWVVVCNGAKALILENAGARTHPNLVTKEVLQHQDPKTHELGTDRPGRAFQSVGAMRSALEQTDWHAQEEQRFLARLASRLDKAVLLGETKAVIVVAAPRALGVLRGEYSLQLRQAVKAEVDKDLSGMPVPEITRHLAETEVDA
jgi:protein required for attachment to host cells